MNIKPIGDRVIISLIEEDRKTATGIIIPDMAREKPQKGIVIAAGEGKVLENGCLSPILIKPGQIVLFGRYSGSEVEKNGEKYLILYQDDIMGIIQEEKCS